MAEKDYTTCLVIPAGRKRYLEVLIPQLISQAGWDSLQLWANTRDPVDLQHLQTVQALDERIVILEPPLKPPNGSATIGQFFRACVDPRCVYIRFDDDICYVEPGLIDKLARYRWLNPAPFLVSPIVINNAVCSYLLQRYGRINTNAKLRPDCFDHNGWRSADFAEKLHRVFLQAVQAGTVRHFHFPDTPVSLCRFSINCISWLGSEFARFGGEVPLEVDEEEWLSVTKPSGEGRFNEVFGSGVVSHFSFFTQREHLDNTDLLAHYRVAAQVSL